MKIIIKSIGNQNVLDTRTYTWLQRHLNEELSLYSIGAYKGKMQYLTVRVDEDIMDQHVYCATLFAENNAEFELIPTDGKFGSVGTKLLFRGIGAQYLLSDESYKYLQEHVGCELHVLSIHYTAHGNIDTMALFVEELGETLEDHVVVLNQRNYIVGELLGGEDICKRTTLAYVED